MMHMYRIRPLQYALGDYQELEKQQIYFAPFDEQNDPIEGVFDVFWRGDLVVWKNLLSNYILCLCNKFVLATLCTDDREFLDDIKIPVHMTLKELPGRYSEIVNQVITHFFTRKEITLLLEYLSNRKVPIRRNELIYHLKSINRMAMHSTILVHTENGLYRDSTGITDFLVKDESNIFTVLTTLETIQDEDKVDEFFRCYSHAEEQVILASQLNRDDSYDRRLEYLIISFPKLYAKDLDDLVYSKWYMACFMSSCTNSLSWGNYGNNHTGICLKFKTYNDAHGMYLPIERPVGFDSNGKIVKLGEMYFDKVEYGNDRTPVDFFRSMLTLPSPKLYESWYTDDTGAISVCADVLQKIEGYDVFDAVGTERQKYWNIQKRITTSKALDWKDENEYRLILTPLLFDYTEPKDRVLKYDFKDLDGVIFGHKTPDNAKKEILTILDKKCKELNREDFKVYQAGFNRSNNEMIIDELTMVRLG